MKSGASDPFAEDTSDDDERRNDQIADDAETETEPTSTSVQSEETVQPDSNTHQFRREDLPLTLRRDNVKDERENVHQLFVQSNTDDRAKDAERELESLVGEDVYRLDAREAIYLAGMQNLTDAADVLREWGYDL